MSFYGIIGDYLTVGSCFNASLVDVYVHDACVCLISVFRCRYSSFSPLSVPVVDDCDGVLVERHEENTLAAAAAVGAPSWLIVCAPLRY